MLQPRTLTLLGIIAAIALFRFLPHPPNVSPVAAMALFGGALFADRRLALLVPFAAMLVSDLFIGMHDTMLYVYGAFALTVGIGMLIRDRLGIASVVLASIGSSLLFFLVTNFGVWATAAHGYAMNAGGLMQAYIAGLPFLHYSLLGNLVFTAVLFGSYLLLQRYRPALLRA